MHQKHLDHAKRAATDALKTASKIAIHKAAKPIGDLIDKIITDKILNSLRKSTTE